MIYLKNSSFKDTLKVAAMACPYMVQTSLSFMAITALAEIHRVFNRAELANQDPTVPIVKEIMKARNKHIVLHGLGREGLMMKGFAMRLFHLGLRKVHVFGEACTPQLKEGDLLIVSSGPGWFSSADSIIVEATASGARALVITSKPEGEAAKLASVVAIVPAQTIAEPDFPPGEEPPEQLADGVEMVDGKMPWQLDHANQKAGKVPAGDPMAAAPKGKSKLSVKLDDMIAKSEAAKKGSIKEGGEEVRGSKAGSMLMVGDQAEGSGLKAGLTLYPPEKARFVVTDNKILPMGSCYEGALFILFEIVVYTLREKLQETLPIMRGRNTNLDHFPPTHACGPPPPSPPPTPPGECGRRHSFHNPSDGLGTGVEHWPSPKPSLTASPKTSLKPDAKPSLKPS